MDSALLKPQFKDRLEANFPKNTMAQPSFSRSRTRNSRFIESDRTSRPASAVLTIILAIALGGLGWIWIEMLDKGYLAIGGVPSPIIVSFFQNEIARKAYFDGDNEKLYAQVQSMGLADKLKSYYRSQFEDEAQLDRYTNQILYDRTGYIGKAYQVNPQGTLVLKKLIKTESSAGLKVRR